MAAQKREYVEVRHPATGRLLLRFCAASDTIEVKRRHEPPVEVSLTPYRRGRQDEQR